MQIAYEHRSWLLKKWPGLTVCLLSVLLFGRIHGLAIAVDLVLIFAMHLSIYFGFRLKSDPVSSLFYCVVIVILMSFLPFDHMGLILGLLSIIAITLILLSSDNRINKAKLLKELMRIRNVQWIGISLVLLIIMLSAIKHRGGYLLFDRFHLFYELSIGRSFETSLINPPDLSYSGKLIRSHFLSSRLPLLFKSFVSKDLVLATYLKVPFWLSVVLIHALLILFKTWPKFKIRLAFFYFLPMAWVLPLPESLVFRTLLSGPGFHLAMAMSIIFFMFFLSNKKVRLIICLMFLLLIKGSFFVSLSAGYLLYLLIIRRYRELMISVAVLSSIFLMFYFLFLSGAHSHNLWSIFPSYLSYYFRPDGLQARHIYGAVLLLAFCIWPLYEWSKKIRREDSKVFSLALSGLLLSGVFSELTENNGLQFFIASMPFCLFSLHLFLSGLLNKKLKYALLALAIIASATNSLIIIKALYPLQIREVALRIPGVPFLYTVIRDKEPEPSISHLSLEKAEAYQSLCSSKEGHALYLNLFGHGLERSALSGIPFYTESMWFKGIAMQDNYARRIAETTAFYSYAATNKEPIKRQVEHELLRSSEEEPKTLSESNPVLFKLSFGKQWSRFNLQPKLRRQFAQEYNQIVQSQESQLSFLKRENINILCFENGAKPIREIYDLCEPVYSGESILILSVNSEKLNEAIIQHRNTRM